MDVEARLGVKRVCYCSHHASGNEDCDNCIGCKASRDAVQGETERAAKIVEDHADQALCCPAGEGSKRNDRGFCEGFGHTTLYDLADKIRNPKQ